MDKCWGKISRFYAQTYPQKPRSQAPSFDKKDKTITNQLIFVWYWSLSEKVKADILFAPKNGHFYSLVTEEFLREKLGY
jgi:hypothetical protein